MTGVAGSDWLAVAIAVPILGYFALRTLVHLAAGWLGRDVPVDEEMLGRGQSFLLGQSLRQVFALSTDPIARLLQRLGVRPNTLTLASLVVTAFAGALIALGHVALGGVVGLLGSSLDYFDGRVARKSQQDSRAGAFLDSTLDRYADIALSCGAAMLFRDQPWILLACLVGMGCSVVISYTRAKAESMGAELKVGLMQRPERIVVFGLGAILSPFLDSLLPAAFRGQHAVFAAAVVVLAILSAITSVHRTAVGFANIQRGAAEP